MAVIGIIGCYVCIGWCFLVFFLLGQTVYLGPPPSLMLTLIHPSPFVIRGSCLGGSGLVDKGFSLPRFMDQDYQWAYQARGE